MREHFQDKKTIVENPLFIFSYPFFHVFILLFINTIIMLFPGTSMATPDLTIDSSIKSFQHIYEPSGLLALPDGRLIIIEDESSDAFHILNVLPDGSFQEDYSLTDSLMNHFDIKLNDLEGITQGPDGYIYAITSHKRKSNGKRSASREHLVRFKIENNEVSDVSIYNDLVDAIENSGILNSTEEQMSNINIESICFDRAGKLMIGFRSPQNGENTIIGVLENPSDIFNHQAEAIISEVPILINLYGGGIRAMAYDDSSGGYLISNEVKIKAKKKKKTSQILFWDGVKSHPAIPVIQPGLKNIEGIAILRLAAEVKVLLCSDNGKKSKNRNANYLYLKSSIK